MNSTDAVLALQVKVPISAKSLNEALKTPLPCHDAVHSQAGLKTQPSPAFSAKASSDHYVKNPTKPELCEEELVS